MDGSAIVKILGGADPAREILANLPGSWRVMPFGGAWILASFSPSWISSSITITRLGGGLCS